MRKLRPSTRTFLLDTNVFIAAIKDPERQTNTFQLLLKIIRDPSIRLVGNVLLAEEMRRYVELFKSKRAAMLASALLGKMKLVRVPENYVRACKAYIRTPDKADVLHAATCLQTGAVLITNDTHFDRSDLLPQLTQGASTPASRYSLIASAWGAFCGSFSLSGTPGSCFHDQTRSPSRRASFSHAVFRVTEVLISTGVGFGVAPPYLCRKSPSAVYTAFGERDGRKYSCGSHPLPFGRGLPADKVKKEGVIEALSCR